MTPALMALIDPDRVVRDVTLRLAAVGAVTELQHLARFSPAELEVLVRQEIGVS